MMKQRIYIIVAIFLLLVVVAYMARDLFFSPKENVTNPYEYELAKLKKSDSSLLAYAEKQQVKTSLEEIHGVAVDASDQIYVCGKEGVELFDMTGNPEKKFSIGGIANCLYIDQKGTIYLGIQDHVEVYNAEGKLRGKWKSCGEDAFITSIAVTDSFAFLADAGKKVVYRYDLSGRQLNRIGEKDPERNVPGFVIPSPYFDLGIGKENELWVVNPGRHTFEKYSYDGRLISSWGEGSMSVEGFCGCCNPSNFALLSDGSFVTSEKGIERVKVYSPQGKFECVVAEPDSFEAGTKGLDLAVDTQDRIIVLDPVKKLIRIFLKKS